MLLLFDRFKNFYDFTIPTWVSPIQKLKQCREILNIKGDLYLFQCSSYGVDSYKYGSNKQGYIIKFKIKMDMGTIRNGVKKNKALFSISELGDKLGFKDVH